MKTMRWNTEGPYGFNGSGACARWSAVSSNAFGGHAAAIPAMDAVKLTAVRPLGIEGGTTG
jgi:hypothetical protein